MSRRFSGWQREQARALGYERPETAAVSFCQRVGSSLNLNIHWHVIVPDAVFLPDASGERVDTLKHRASTRLDLKEIVTTVAIRAIRWLERHGYLRSDGDEDPTENADTASPWMPSLQGSLGAGELQRWAEHGSDIHPLECSSCGGRTRFVEVIEDVARRAASSAVETCPSGHRRCLGRARPIGSTEARGSADGSVTFPPIDGGAWSGVL